MRCCVYAAVGGVVVIAGAAVAFEMLQGGRSGRRRTRSSRHSQIGTYAQAPALAARRRPSQVRRSIVAQSNGEASNVVAAVYKSRGSQPSPSASPGHGSTAPGGAS